MEKHFEYTKPHENSELAHKIALEFEGELIGEAMLEYRNHPFPFYYLEIIYVNDVKKGQGFGRDILEKVNEYLNEHGKRGILLNAIPQTSAARDMYARHGWKNIDGHKNFMGYELDDLPREQIEKAIQGLIARTNRFYQKDKPAAA